MPLLHIKEGEIKREYLNRFMKENKFIEEYPNDKQRYIIAINYWNKQRRKKRNEIN